MEHARRNKPRDAADDDAESLTVHILMLMQLAGLD